MAVVTPAQEYKRLRAYLNPYIKGPKVDAVLNALASGMSSVLINNASAINDNMYIVSAVGTYLDSRLAEYGITRPSAVGLSDDIFTEIGLEVKNRKQVRDLMANILNSIFGAEFVRASDPARAVEPYNLQDGDTLIINYDANTTTTITFSTSQFADIAAATAQEVADAITETLTTLNIEGAAISQNDGNGNYVMLISNTIGPRSSVTVLGGSAENQLLFDSPVGAAGDATTQWTVTIQPGGYMRFMWSGGTNPNVGDVTVGNYVNIYNGGFTGSPNAGTYTITSFVGGAVNVAYFEVYNPFGIPGIITQGLKSAVLFYNPVKKTLNSIPSYAAIFQVSSALLQIFLPASTQVIRRSRAGSAYIHFPPQGTFQLVNQPINGDVFVVTTTYSVTAGIDFVIGTNLTATVNNMVAAINTANLGLLAVANRTGDFVIDTVDVFNTSLSNTLVISCSDTSNIVSSGPLGSNLSLEPNQNGPYTYDLGQPFVVSATHTKLAQVVNADTSRVIQVASSAGFPNSAGYLIFGYGTSHQEGPVPYLGAPSPDTLWISPAYTFQNIQPPGTSVFLVAQKNPAVIDTIGDQFPFYLTDVVSGRIYAQNLIQAVAAAGIKVVFTILYPGDIGLGKWGTPYSEIPIIWGP